MTDIHTARHDLEHWLERHPFADPEADKLAQRCVLHARCLEMSVEDGVEISRLVASMAPDFARLEQLTRGYGQ